jgi:hypothetical protein
LDTARNSSCNWLNFCHGMGSTLSNEKVGWYTGFRVDMVLVSRLSALEGSDYQFPSANHLPLLANELATKMI